ncbi:MAG: glycosyltransferase family 39 protein [Crocinitomicaceae bacterium]
MDKYRIYILWLTLSAIVVKLLLLPFAQTVDADAVSRVHLSVDWLNNPEWIKTSVWSPLHFYLNGLGLMLWNDSVITPKLINILLSSLSILPFFYFTRREFNSRGAFIASIFFAVSPILFRNSFMALSETPYLLLLLLTLNLISKGLREDNTKSVLLAGLTITLACGFRYEAWLLAFLFGLIILFTNWRKAFGYGLISLVFPIIWMASNYVTTGDVMFSIQGNYKWTLELMGNNDFVDTETMLRRLWFFPFSWMISIGPPVVYLTVILMFRTIKGYKADKLKAFFASLFVIMLVFFIYNSMKGVLLLQHRFIGTLVVLSLPFIAIIFEEKSVNKTRQAWVFGVLIIGLSFVYNTSQIKPVPRLGDQSKAEVSKIINANLEDDSALILDFIGWEYSYFYALRSEVNVEDLILVQGAKNSMLPEEKLLQILEKHESFVVVLNHDSEFRTLFLKHINHADLTLLQSNNDFEVYSFQKN